MKIHGTDGTAGIQELLQRIRQSEGTPQQQELESKPSQPNVEKVEISPQAKEIQRLKTTLNEIPDVRSEKIEEVRQAMETGKYQVDLNAVSERILKSMLIGDI
jgi:negative regulator of flagellin synthesis FlgM